MTSPKSYWFILKTLLDNKKILCISSLLHDDKFVTNYKEKAKISSNFLAKLCSLINTVIFLQFFQGKHKLMSAI